MNAADFQCCLDVGENISIEFKRCGNLPEEDTFESICSFANRQGGNVFLGVRNDGTVLGVNPKAVLDIERNVVNVVNNPTMFNVPPAIETERIDYHGLSVLRIWVPVSSIVHKYKHVVYDRISDADVKVRTDTQLSAMYIRKQEYYSERKVYRHLLPSDLRLDLLPRVRTMATAKRADHPWRYMTDEELLRSANLFTKDYDTGEEGLTLAAALLLGKDNVIRSILPAYRTDAYVQLADVDRYDDRVVVTTNLIEAYDQLMAFARKHLPDKFYLEDAQSKSLRDMIVRELVSNLLMHREFTSPFPAKFVIDREGIKTENANRPRFVGTLSPERFNPLPKNPIIADFFMNIGFADTLGSGTRNLFKYAWIYGGSAPTLEEDDVFRATVVLNSQTNKVAVRKDVDAVIMQMLEEAGFISVATVAAAAEVTPRTVRRHISLMVKDGILKSEGSTRDRRYVLQENKTVPDEGERVQSGHIADMS